MKVLVFYLYFANPKGSGCAFMRILSYIDFYNQFSAFKGKKKKKKKEKKKKKRKKEKKKEKEKKKN